MFLLSHEVVEADSHSEVHSCQTASATQAKTPAHDILTQPFVIESIQPKRADASRTRHLPLGSASIISMDDQNDPNSFKATDPHSVALIKDNLLRILIQT
ncbi:hypothetical protein RSSM_00342 [Rhodopirellula sallentina SM41]|uniref:Uncharacterized protein n=1 Tax=Rhodopirellula sallentina SM41 TaxID=1263870 RepID=M5U9Y5_9BACT|nr:hypothetical protein RSSM_00342 [Rhodopirellula sallentina SM41]